MLSGSLSTSEHRQCSELGLEPGGGTKTWSDARAEAATRSATISSTTGSDAMVETRLVMALYPSRPVYERGRNCGRQKAPSAPEYHPWMDMFSSTSTAWAKAGNRCSVIAAAAGKAERVLDIMPTPCSLYAPLGGPTILSFACRVHCLCQASVAQSMREGVYRLRQRFNSVPMCLAQLPPRLHLPAAGAIIHAPTHHQIQD